MNADKLREIALPFVEACGCDLVSLTLTRQKENRLLRLMVEKKGSDPATGSGVDHAICARISRALDEALEAGAQMGETPYLLEVSSPGIERPLVCEADYRRFAGRRVKVKLRRAVLGKKKYVGVLDGVLDGNVMLRVKDGDKPVALPGELVAKANLVFDETMLKRSAGEE